MPLPAPVPPPVPPVPEPVPPSVPWPPSPSGEPKSPSRPWPPSRCRNGALCPDGDALAAEACPIQYPPSPPIASSATAASATSALRRRGRAGGGAPVPPAESAGAGVGPAAGSHRDPLTGRSGLTVLLGSDRGCDLRVAARAGCFRRAEERRPARGQVGGSGRRSIVRRRHRGRSAGAAGRAVLAAYAAATRASASSGRAARHRRPRGSRSTTACRSASDARMSSAVVSLVAVTGTSGGRDQVPSTVLDPGETSTWSGSEPGKSRVGSTVNPTSAPPPSRARAKTVPPCALRDVADDRQAEPGAGHAAGGVRPVEAVEHARGFRGVDAGPVVGDDDLARQQPDLDGRAVRVELGGVLQQVADGALQRPAACRARHRPGRRRRPRSRRPLRLPTRSAARPTTAARSTGPPRPPRPGGRGRASTSSSTRWDSSRVSPWTSSTSSVARLRGQLVDAAQHAGVGAQAGQRGAQLVGGVLDEALLRVPRGGEPGEHRVERRRQPRHLVAALHRHAARPGRSSTLTSLRDPREPDQATGDPPRQQPSGARGDGQRPRR